MNSMLEAKPQLSAVAQFVGSGSRKSKMLYLSMELTDTLSARCTVLSVSDWSNRQQLNE